MCDSGYADRWIHVLIVDMQTSGYMCDSGYADKWIHV